MRELFDECQDLEFLRARLKVLARRRRTGPLTPAEDAEYRELCARELTLLNNSAPPVDSPPRPAARRSASELELQEALRRAASED